MKQKYLDTFIILFLFLIIPKHTVFAATAVTPDIRATEILVDTRRMPSRECFGRQPEEWIRHYVGHNQIVNQQIKFYADLEPDSKQLEETTKRLAPHIFNTNSKKTVEEKENKPAMNGRICAWQGEKLIEPPPSQDIIYAENEIDTSVKRQYWDWSIFSSIVARGSVERTNGTYNLQRKEIVPDTQHPLSCDDKPPGAEQKDKQGVNSNEHIFYRNWWEQLALDFSCAYGYIDNNGEMYYPCACIDTEMWIMPDTTIPYGSYTSCNSAGCKTGPEVKTEVEHVAQAHQADENSKNSGGAANFTRTAHQKSISDLVKTVIGSPMGTVLDQAMKNAQNTKIVPLSWSFTKDWEVATDFVNCSLYPYTKRKEIPECNVNWFAKTKEEFKR